MHRIGILSDTHGLLRPEAKEALVGCEAILHCGDIGGQEILDELGRIAPVKVVCGNCDKEWAKEIPRTLYVRLFGLTFFMIHDRDEIGNEVTAAFAGSNVAGQIDAAHQVDIVVCGHTHRYEEIYEESNGAAGGRRLWLNPGSCGPRRLFRPITLAVIEVEDNGTYRVRRREIGRRGLLENGLDAETRGDKPHGEGGQDGPNAEVKSGDGQIEIPPDIGNRIPMIIKDMSRGRSIREIAERAGISPGLAEQICRLYVTHPGVDVDGILRRLGL